MRFSSFLQVGARLLDSLEMKISQVLTRDNSRLVLAYFQMLKSMVKHQTFN